MKDVSIEQLHEQRAELVAALNGDLPEAVRAATEAQVKRIDSRIMKLEGKRAILRDGTSVGVGDSIFTYQIGHRPHREWVGPKITEHKVRAISPRGWLSITNYRGRPDYRDPGLSLSLDSIPYGSYKAAATACIERMRKLAEAASKNTAEAVKREEEAYADLRATEARFKDKL